MPSTLRNMLTVTLVIINTVSTGVSISQGRSLFSRLVTATARTGKRPKDWLRLAVD